eukprot:1366471-Rhodomonas_salina.6
MSSLSLLLAFRPPRPVPLGPAACRVVAGADCVFQTAAAHAQQMLEQRANNYVALEQLILLVRRGLDPLAPDSAQPISVSMLDNAVLCPLMWSNADVCHGM